jgi:hypothetical protein
MLFEFRRKLHNATVPNTTVIDNYMKGFGAIGSILVGKRICSGHVLTEGTLDETDFRLETSRRQSLV